MTRKTILLTAFIFILQNYNAQKINWIPIEKAFELQKNDPKPIIIDFYTEWCGWCKRMDVTTYQDPQLIAYLNQNFYSVKFDAEGKDSIKINGQKYINPNPNNPRSAHQYSSQLGVNSFPTTLFFDRKGQNPVTVPGYLQALDMFPILSFYSDDLFQLTDINQYVLDFKRTYSPTPEQLAQVNPSPIRWYGITEGLEKAKADKKKIWIQTTASNCINCSIIDSTVYNNPFLAKYLTEHYIPIKFDVFSMEKFELQGKVFMNTSPMSYHQLIIGALGNEAKVPSLIIFDENQQLLAPVNSYIHKKYTEALAKYFRDRMDLQKVDFGQFIQNLKYECLN